MEKKKIGTVVTNSLLFFLQCSSLPHNIPKDVSLPQQQNFGASNSPVRLPTLPSHQNRHKLKRAQTIEFMAPVRYHIPFQYPAETYYRLFLPALAPSDPLFTLLSCHLAHPASTRSSSTTKSLIRNALANPVSNPHSNHPLRLSSVVNPNHTSANAAPAAHPTRTCLPV